MAKKRSRKSSSRKSSSSQRASSQRAQTSDKSRPPKKPLGPKQRSCTLDEDQEDSQPSDSEKMDQSPIGDKEQHSGPDKSIAFGRLPWLLLGASLLALAGLVLPWEGTWFGALAIHPSTYAPWLDSPAMLGALPLLGLLMLPAALAVVWSAMQRQRQGSPVTGAPPKGQVIAEWILGITALVGLAVTAYYNESLNLSPFAGIADHFWGIPLLVPAALAGGALVAWKRGTATRGTLAKLLTWSAAVLLVSALVPVYEFGERHLPVTAALLRLGKGGAQSLAGLSALVIWVVAALGLVLGLAVGRHVNDAAETKGSRSRRGKTGKAKHRQAKTAPSKRAGEHGRQAQGDGPMGRLAPLLGWLLLLAPPLSALAAALAAQTGRPWFLGAIPEGADTQHHLAALTGTALAALTAAWSLALAWTAPRLAVGLLFRSHRDQASVEEIQVTGQASHAMHRILFWGAAALLGSAFLVLELQAVGFTVTDENIYYYQAMLLAQGKLPYRDFFFAHPPLHILIPAILFRVFGFHLLLAKAISITAGLGTGLMVLLTGRRIAGDLTALAAAALYLFSFAVLNAAINMTGMNLTVFFLMTGVYLLLSGRPGWGGLAAGAAMSTGFYSAAAAAALLAAALLRSPAFGARFALGLFGTWGGINLFFWAMSGSAFLDGVYRYHGKKLPQDPRHVFYSDSPVKALFTNIYVLLTGREFKKTMFYHAHLLVPWALAAAAWIAVRVRKLPLAWSRLEPAKALPPWICRLTQALVGSVRRKSGGNTPGPKESLEASRQESRLVDKAPHDRDKKQVARRPRGIMERIAFFGDWLWADAGLAVIWLVALALIVEFSMFRRLYSFYFVLWYPFMALAAAWLLVGMLKSLARGRSASAVLLAAGLLWAASLHPALANWGGSVHKGELQRKGHRIEYPWRKAGALKAATPLVKALFWRGYRLRAEPAESIHQFLWNKKRHFDEAPEIARFIQDSTTADQTIAGASAVAPLLAILAHRHIAAEIVDTNTNRFKAGLITEEEFYRRICQTKLAYLVSSPMSFFSWRKMRFHARFLEHFTLERTFPARSVRFRGVFPVRLLKNEYGAARPPYCRFLGKSRLPRPLRRQRRRFR